MELRDIIASAWTSLRTNKMRTMLTLLGMVIGVFAIIVSITAVKVIDVYFEEKMSFLGTSTFTISRYESFSVTERDFRYRPRITMEQIDRLKRSLDEYLVVSVIEDFDMTAIRYGARETEPNVAILGTDENFVGNFSYTIEYGRNFTPEDVQYGRKVTILGASVAEELFASENPIGKVTEFGGARYQVIGVLEAKGNFLGFNMDDRVFVPMQTLFLRYGGAHRNIASTSVRTPGPQFITAGMEEVIGRLRTIRKVPPGEDNDFVVETNDSMRAIFDQFTTVLTQAGAAIGLISLLAAGIGIMNIMLVSVTERTREIGIRKALGARRRDIMRQFILEAIFLCQIGGGAGFLLGVLAGNGTALYFNITATIPWVWAGVTIAIVAIVALVFGGYPALKAARLNPIDSLRYE